MLVTHTASEQRHRCGGLQCSLVDRSQDWSPVYATTYQSTGKRCMKPPRAHPQGEYRQRQRQGQKQKDLVTPLTAHTG
jgi:hypothetical protein